MKISKKRLVLEYELNAKSPRLVWSLLSESSGLSRWFADEVERKGSSLTFTWGTSWQNKDVRPATIVKEVKNVLLRFKWEGDEDPNAYCEMKIEMGDITNDCVLVVTDFAEPDDVDSLKDLWEDNIVRLRQISGL